MNEKQTRWLEELRGERARICDAVHLEIARIEKQGYRATVKIDVEDRVRTTSEGVEISLFSDEPLHKQFVIPEGPPADE